MVKCQVTQSTSPSKGGPQSGNIPLARMPHIATQYLNTSKILRCVGIDFDKHPTLELETLPQKHICIKVNVWHDNVALPTITSYDVAIMDAVYTLSTNGCTTYTPTMIARVMANNPTLELTDSRQQKLIDHIEKLRHIHIKIDSTLEFIARKLIPDTETAVFSTPLLPLCDTPVRSKYKNKTTQGYQLTNTPAMYQYAETIHQIANIPADMCRTHKISDTDTTILLKRYLAYRIALMRNRKNNIRSNTIAYYSYNKHHKTYTGIYPVVGFAPETNRTRKARLHHDVQTILNCFKESKYIDDYAVIRDGSGGKTCPVSGINIVLPT